MTSKRHEKELDEEDRKEWQRELAAAKDEYEKQQHVRLFAFRCGNEWYAIDPTKVIMIDAMPDIHTLPHRPESLAGMINLRGVVTLCFSLNKILKCANSPGTDTPVLLALEHNNWQVGCLTDEALGIVTFIPSEATPPPSTLGSEQSHHVCKQFSVQGRSFACINADALFHTFREVAH